MYVWAYSVRCYCVVCPLIVFVALCNCSRPGDKQNGMLFPQYVSRNVELNYSLNRMRLLTTATAFALVTIYDLCVFEWPKLHWNPWADLTTLSQHGWQISSSSTLPSSNSFVYRHQQTTVVILAWINGLVFPVEGLLDNVQILIQGTPNVWFRSITWLGKRSDGNTSTGEISFLNRMFWAGFISTSAWFSHINSCRVKCFCRWCFS